MGNSAVLPTSLQTGSTGVSLPTISFSDILNKINEAKSQNFMSGTTPIWWQFDTAAHSQVDP